MKILSLNRIAIATIALSMVALVFSCKKDSSQNSTLSDDDAVTYSEESMEAQASYDDVEDIGMIAADEEGVVSAGKGTEAGRLIFPFVTLRARIGNCADITVTPNDSTYPKTVTIDFGTDGCRGLDNRLRKGKIILSFTGPIRRPGSVLTITLQDFYINRIHVEGSKVISNLSDSVNIKFTVQVIDGKVTNPGGRGYTYNALRYVKQMAGGLTNEVLDDVYSIEGRSSTQFTGGFSIVLNTESPLVKKVSCPWISNGKVKITIKNRVLFLDYGASNNGDCDNKALLTWNNGNNQRLIILP
jgi:hypothetical protein